MTGDPQTMRYAELQTTSNFGFLRGASHPEELVVQAQALGLAGLALTDRNSLAGVVRAHAQAKASGLRFLVGCRLDLVDGTSLLCWPTDKPAYARLSSLLTHGKRLAAKGGCTLTLDDVLAHGAGQVLALLPPETPDAAFAELAVRLRQRWRCDLYLALTHRHAGDDARRLASLAELALAAGIEPLATNDVHYHHPDRRPLQDVLTCIREHVRIHEAAPLLFAHAERHLKPPDEMARLFRDHPQALASTLAIVERCRFSLSELAYDYPVQASYAGRTPDEELARRTLAGARTRYPGHLPAKVEQLLRHELALIRKLRFAPYFLTVHDIVEYRPQPGHPLPGPGLGRQLRRLLRAGRHRGRPGAHGPPVRALRLDRARRAARHRRRFRARAARGGDPVDLRDLRPRPRGAGRHRRSATAPSRRCARSAR